MADNWMDKRLAEIENFAAEMGFTSQLVPGVIPTLVVTMPSEEEAPELVMTINPLPLDEGDAYTDYIQIYVEMPLDLDEFAELTFLRELDVINKKLPLGACVRIEPREDLAAEQMMGLRYVFTAEKDRLLAKETFEEMFLMVVLSCDGALQHFLDLMGAIEE
jgi:hypothetical protein